MDVWVKLNERKKSEELNRYGLAIVQATANARAVLYVVVGTIYHPPSADDRAMTTHILHCLDTVTHDHPYAGVILVGDFNQLRDAALLSYPPRQVVKSPTRCLAVLDKSIQDWYEMHVILPNIGSDHDTEEQDNRPW